MKLSGLWLALLISKHILTVFAGAKQKNGELVYWVNMDSSKWRNNYMIDQFARFQIPNMRIRATLVENVQVEENAPMPECTKCKRDSANCPRAIKPVNSTSSPGDVMIVTQLCTRPRTTIKELACSISHLRAILAAVENEEASSLPSATSDTASLSRSFLGEEKPYALIMEDDIKLEFDIDFDKLVASAPPDWGVLQLQGLT